MCTNVSQTLACIHLAWGICCGNTVFDSTDLRWGSSPHVMLTLLVQCHCDRIWAHLEDKLPGTFVMDCFDKGYLLTMLVREYIYQGKWGGKIHDKVGDTILWVWVLDDNNNQKASWTQYVQYVTSLCFLTAYIMCLVTSSFWCHGGLYPWTGSHKNPSFFKLLWSG